MDIEFSLSPLKWIALLSLLYSIFHGVGYLQLPIEIWDSLLISMANILVFFGILTDTTTGGKSQ